ncbi:c-type cytochrome biogenesis protein CcsB [Nanchangia anserum]|uniref:C-type cytochrome biogenesis protein CcsB n=1 Tax=Nanchangia anserum TaxID=2692125 RepID=A0A8I0GAH5_9ACTO|nr:c-type cytochrome biogenesis protein CcsB [Nanchangia anserum]MBD3690149.1 c-type cytochrome biogenesis protein CcsB [Nanchangia anserum]QOX82072.1 c-type cytochrome biogenesis protein CcsB [Nanchangia anserum]
MLELAEYLLAAATVFVVAALVANLIVVFRYKSVPTLPDGEKPTISVGGGPSRAVTTPAPTRAGWFGTAFHVLAWVALTIYLGIRIALTGHGPFANQHEFAVSFCWGILLVFLVFALRYGLRAISLVVLPVVAALLLYAHTLDSGVEPLVPALQNNLLLSLHVGFAVVAYGAACVSFGAALLWLVQPKLPAEIRPRRELLDEIGYRAAVTTFPLLTIMIVLGALWADTAWGRYWGWDPKETAAFVTWLIYGGYLHARVVADWRGRRAAWLLIIGFAAVLFAYFGNHFFGGLHSYG